MEQTAQIEEMMSLYLKTDINTANQTALNNILNDEEQQKNEHFINFISSGTLMLSIVFGLPSIYESLRILRKTTLGILENNIPYITIENLSIILWLLLNFFIIIRLLCKK